ncbi:MULTISPECIES: hypothetical protein [Novosphingobium]|jgi:ABC-type uncharacterized transport system auxiliary subunit|uniref:hypothetical protein n=1 Tax=Novosphingobium TaxID=165696 RepID=UPI0022F253B3|nr:MULTISPECIES: hypothetical protein [Novosphingobium]GLK45144.1 hypothetical protein GCM10017612_30640 [Novosphingobium resinovorum]
MRVGLITALVLAAILGGCKREPTFEERYKAANKTIVDRARQIDAQIAATGSPPLEEDGVSPEH